MPKNFCTIHEVLGMLGISRNHLFRLVREDKFPKPQRMSARGIYWDYEEVLTIANERYSKRPKKKYIVDSQTIEDIKALIREIERG